MKGTSGGGTAGRGHQPSFGSEDEEGAQGDRHVLGGRVILAATEVGATVFGERSVAC